MHPTTTKNDDSNTAPTRSLLLKNNETINFEEVWPTIEELITKIFSCDPITKAQWQDIFWKVHLICVWDYNSAIQLQQKLVQIFTTYINGEEQHIVAMGESNDDLSLLNAYIVAWKQFMFYYTYIPLPFAPLEKYFYKKAVINGGPKRRVEIENYIRLTMIEMWVLQIFSKVNSRLIQGVMTLIDYERNNIPCHPYLILGVKESCLCLCNYLQDKLFIYRNNFERVYIETTQSYYQTNGSRYFYQNGILSYLRWVDHKIKEEIERAQKYLEPHSMSKVISAIVQTLITTYKDHMASKFLTLIKNNDISLLNLMFSLLDRAENGIEPMLRYFEEYFLDLGISNMKMEALAITHDSEKYIEHLLKLFNMATTLIKDAFNSDPRFLTARDIAFNSLVNDKSVFILSLSLKQNSTNINNNNVEMCNFNNNANNANRKEMGEDSNNNDGELKGDQPDKIKVAETPETVSASPTNPESQSQPNEPLVLAPLAPLLLQPLQQQQLPSQPQSAQSNLALQKWAETRCPDLFANYCDMLLRKTTLSRHLTSEQIESKLKHVILLLKYVQDKDVFMKYYKAHLTRRLILEASADNDKEELMVNWLREVGMPADFVNKLSRMFQDLKVSEDFNQQFKVVYCNAPFCDIISVKILNSSAWNRTYEKINLSLPGEIEEILPKVEEYYKRKHNGRNLIWHHQFSSGVITYTSDNGTYDMDVTSYQISVIYCWNDRPETEISLEALSLYTNLPNVELRRTLWSLISNPKLKSQLIVIDSSSNPNSVKNHKDFQDSTLFRLNTKFALYSKAGRILKRGRINLIGRLQLLSEKSPEDEAESILRLRMLRVQEAIMKILKTRKSANYTALQLELTNVLKQMFIPSKQLIKEQIEWLIEHEYIKRDCTDSNLFYYCQ